MPIDIQTAAPPVTPEGGGVLSPDHCPDAKRAAYQGNMGTGKTEDGQKIGNGQGKEKTVPKSEKVEEKEKPKVPKSQEVFTESDAEARYRGFKILCWLNRSYDVWRLMHGTVL